MTKKVYWCGLEYSYLETPSEAVDLKGGFVYAFVYAFDVREALDHLLDVLSNKKLIPVEIEFISPYDLDMEWESEQETKRFLGLANEASESREVLFDDFYAYEQE